MSDNKPDFSNRMEVLRHLKLKGYDLKQSTLYTARHKAMLIPDKGAGFSLKAVERYTKAAGLMLPGSQPLDEIAKNKREAEADLLTQKAATATFKLEVLQGKYIERAEHDRQLVARAMLLKADLLRIPDMYMGEIVEEVDGDQTRTPYAAEILRHRMVEALDRYARAGEIKLEASV